MKNAYTLIELLAVIVILSVISVVAYPKVIDIIGASKIKAYDIAKDNIIESAKLKYLADVNSAVVTEYSVLDLIDDGYIKKDAKNPLTNESYDEKTKVLITNENGNVKYNYIQGNTLYNIISTKNDKDGIYKENNEYIYKGANAQNYVSFNEQIYRIIEVDSYRYTYLLKEENDRKINKNNLNSYVNSYYNDNYSEEMKTKISNIEVLSLQMYNNSILQSSTYITNNNNIWINNNGDYKVLSYLDNTLIDGENAKVRLVIKLNNNITVNSGDGTQLSPYMVE